VVRLSLSVLTSFCREENLYVYQGPAISVPLGAFWLCGSGLTSVAQLEIVPGTTFTTLLSFTGTDGNKSFAALVQGSNGNLYGTTYFVGAKNDGEVFQITTTGKLTSRHSFVPQMAVWIDFVDMAPDDRMKLSNWIAECGVNDSHN